MNAAKISRWIHFRCLILVLTAMALVACKLHNADVVVDLVAGKEFKITVRNESDDFLDIDDRLLGRGIDSAVKVEIAQPNGALIPFCRYVDYIGSRKPMPLAPNEELVVSIPLTAVTLTHCLQVNESYKFRAVRVSEGSLVSRTEWVTFRAVSPLADADGR